MGEPPEREPGSARIGSRMAERVADTMFALSTTSRVQILGCLLAGPCSVSELTDALGMEQSAVSHQLRVLREHALVKGTRDGRRRVYELDDEYVVVLINAALSHVDHRSKGRGGLAARVRRSAG